MTTQTHIEKHESESSDEALTRIASAERGLVEALNSLQFATGKCEHARQVLRLTTAEIRKLGAQRNSLRTALDGLRNALEARHAHAAGTEPCDACVALQAASVKATP